MVLCLGSQVKYLVLITLPSFFPASDTTHTQLVIEGIEILLLPMELITYIQNKRQLAKFRLFITNKLKYQSPFASRFAKLASKKSLVFEAHAADESFFKDF